MSLASIACSITKTSQPHLAFLSQSIADAFEMSVMVKSLSGALCSVTFFVAVSYLPGHGERQKYTERQARINYCEEAEK